MTTTLALLRPGTLNVPLWTLVRPSVRAATMEAAPLAPSRDRANIIHKLLIFFLLFLFFFERFSSLCGGCFTGCSTGSSGRELGVETVSSPSGCALCFALWHRVVWVHSDAECHQTAKGQKRLSRQPKRRHKQRTSVSVSMCMYVWQWQPLFSLYAMLSRATGYCTLSQ